ncbi:hypothetical protein ABTE06_22280, partial [Acinetobacter baumannii]
VKDPSFPVITPDFAPLARTDAPLTGLPSASSTVPFITRVCPKTDNTETVKQKKSIASFLIMLIFKFGLQL